jgi:hypothetical protein
VLARARLPACGVRVTSSRSGTATNTRQGASTTATRLA